MSEIISVISAKGGAGKTTVACNVAGAAATLGKKVLLIDLNVGFSGCEVLFNVMDRAAYHLIDVIEGSCKVSDALIPIPAYGDLYLVSGSGTREFSAMSKEAFRQLIALLTPQFDYIFLDVPTGIGTGYRYAMSVASRIVVVSTPDPMGEVVTKRYAQMFPENLREKASLVLNRVRLELVKDGLTVPPEDVVRTIGLPLLGMLPEDEETYLQPEDGTVLIDSKKNPAAKEFVNIARRLLGEEVPINLKSR